MKNFEIKTADFSFAAIATILTGRVFATDEFDKLAGFLSPQDSPNQVMTERETKWIPWLLAQFPYLASIDSEPLTDANAIEWLKRKESTYRGTFVVRAVTKNNK